MSQEEESIEARCGQCTRQAVASMGRHIHLCVRCYYELQIAKTLEFRMQAIGLNHAIEEMDRRLPIGLPSPKMQVPEIPKGPVIMHNISVKDSVVGAINTGNVQSIDVNITYLKQAGHKEIAETLTALTEAIANSEAIATTDRQQMIEQVAYLSEQAASAAKDRKPGMIKAAFSALSSTSSTIAGVANVWKAASPIIRQFFGLD